MAIAAGAGVLVDVGIGVADGDVSGVGVSLGASVLVGDGVASGAGVATGVTAGAGIVPWKTCVVLAGSGVESGAGGWEQAMARHSQTMIGRKRAIAPLFCTMSQITR